MNRTDAAKAAPWMIFAVLIAAAIFVRDHQINRVELEEPIDVRGKAGEWLAGRNIAGIVTGAQLTEQVIGDYGDNHPETYNAHPGWIFAMFDVRAQSLIANGEVSTDLQFGDAVFGAMYLGIGGSLQLTPGIPTEGRIGTFEIPKEAANSTVLLRVTGTARVERDSRLVVAVDLRQAPRAQSVTVRKRIG